MNGPAPKTNKEYLIRIYDLVATQGSRITVCEDCLKQHTELHRDFLTWRTKVTGIWVGVTAVLTVVVVVIGLIISGIKLL